MLITVEAVSQERPADCSVIIWKPHCDNLPGLIAMQQLIHGLQSPGFIILYHVYKEKEAKPLDNLEK